jgi:hypothetical protein
MKIFFRCSLLLLFVVVGANCFSSESGPRSPKIKTYDNGRGLSFEYSDDLFGEPSRTTCDSSGEGCSVLLMQVKGNPTGSFQIDSGGSQESLSTKEYLDDRKKHDYEIFHMDRLQGHLVFNVFLQAMSESRPQVDTKKGSFLWVARGFCSGRMLNVTFEYSPKMEKSKRAEIKSAGSAPQHFVEFLRSIRCESWSSVKDEKTKTKKPVKNKGPS